MGGGERSTGLRGTVGGVEWVDHLGGCVREIDGVCVVRGKGQAGLRLDEGSIGE